jgi:hypothetical protein
MAPLFNAAESAVCELVADKAKRSISVHLGDGVTDLASSVAVHGSVPIRYMIVSNFLRLESTRIVRIRS